jgi:hypothetical protein
MGGIFITTATGKALEDQISLMDKLTSEWTMRAYVDADRAMNALAMLAEAQSMPPVTAKGYSHAV